MLVLALQYVVELTSVAWGHTEAATGLVLNVGVGTCPIYRRYGNFQLPLPL